MNKLIIALCAISILAFASCTKEAGFGGLSTIEGKVYAKDYTPNSGIIEAEGYTADMKVVLAVKGSGRVLKEAKTDLNGQFKFEELRKGTYEIWTFTECDTCTNNETPVIQEAEIKERKEVVTLADFLINI